jgi:radical SAM superfamily enzyme YgiQ (UPF0313 family)
MRVRFIEPRPPGHHVYDRALLPRLGCPLMATMLRERGHDAYCYCDVLAPVDVDDCLRADLVGISATTSTQPYAYRLADELETAGVPVVLGGPHVTFMADEGLEHASYVVRGEGEHTICQLVQALDREESPANIAGLSWRDTDRRAHHNPPRGPCSQQQFQALPIPDLSLIHGHERMTTKPLMTQWGCPYDCEFCAVTAMFSRSVRYRRTDQILTELAGLDAERVFFHDDLFVVNKNRTRDLLRQMLARDLTPQWLAQVRAAETVLLSKASRQPDLELLRLMRDAGCWMVMVGFESISDDALKQMNKKQTVRDIVDAVDLFHRYGIKVHGMFVIGTDTDTAEQADHTVQFAKRVAIDTIQLMIETPLPGTRLYRRAQAEGRIITTDWALYDGHHAVMRPARMHPLDLQRAMLDAMRRFYSQPNIAIPAARTLLRHAPSFARIALRNHVPAQLPTLAALALRHRWHDLLDTLTTGLPKTDRRVIEDALAVPVLRAYGREQITEWQSQDHTRAHLDLLATLP